MSKNELIKRIEYLRELEDMEAEIKDEAETCTEPVKLDNRQKGPLCRIITTQGVMLCRNENTHI